MKRILFLVVLLFSALPLLAQTTLPPAPGLFIGSGPSVDFSKDTPVVAASYFYWYDTASKAHIVNADGSDALTDHPPTLDGISWKSVDWHKDQLVDMEKAGIDVALLVYWGTPEKNQSNRAFSNEGIPPMVEAREKLLAEGKKPAGIAMFYDTSTLQHNAENIRIDLTTDDGKRWFYATIRDFYSLVPPKHRATVDGKPVVFLYAAAFARAVDDTLFPAVQAMFKKEFGCELFIVKEGSFPGDADSTYRWGAALKPQLLETAGVGPGYDHSAVPGRTPLINPRDDGRFYSFSWEQLLVRDPKTRAKWVHVETWNEYHEGTVICETKEYGRQYIELTKKYADLFRSGVQLKEFTVKPKFEIPSGTPEKDEGIVAVDFGKQQNGDGPLEIRDVTWADGGPGKAWHLVTNPTGGAVKYLYFIISEPYFVASPGAEYELVVEYLPPENAAECAPWFTIQYDSSDPALSGTAKHFRGSMVKHLTPEEKQSRQWNTAVFPIVYPGFGRGANGSDFRVAVPSGDVFLRKVTLRRR